MMIKLGFLLKNILLFLFLCNSKKSSRKLMRAYKNWIFWSGSLEAFSFIVAIYNILLGIRKEKSM